MLRKLANPRAPIKSVMVSLQRNLAGFGPNGGMSQCYPGSDNIPYAR